MISMYLSKVYPNKLIEVPQFHLKYNNVGTVKTSFILLYITFF